ncbi:MAG TPA: hypothetical protein VKS01_01970 [Bryobacteraceae bacterium]|nr:hypothetical protein [Bryobacteraceae bacterium]
MTRINMWALTLSLFAGIVADCCDCCGDPDCCASGCCHDCCK